MGYFYKSFHYRSSEYYPVTKVIASKEWSFLTFGTEQYNNTDNSWDGTTKRGIYLSNKVTSGTYFYILELKSINQVKIGYIVIN